MTTNKVRRVASLTALALLMSTTSSCLRERAPGRTQQAHKFYFHESTGTNKFILIDGAESGIEFDHKTSDEGAVNALLSLKWNVLYPNAQGVITLFGTYHPGTQTFSLRHWQLSNPFHAYPGETTLEPGPLEWRDALRRSDFESALGNDPRVYNEPPATPL